jgi:hypothetical protein
VGENPPSLVVGPWKHYASGKRSPSSPDIRSVRVGTVLVNFEKNRGIAAARAITQPFMTSEFALLYRRAQTDFSKQSLATDHCAAVEI